MTKEELTTEKKSFAFDKWAFYLVIIFILIYLVLHFRVGIVAVNKIDSISNIQHYTCPGISDTTDNLRFLGCSPTFIENKIDTNILKRGIVFYWK